MTATINRGLNGYATPRQDNAILVTRGDLIWSADQWRTVLSVVACNLPGHTTRCLALHTAAGVHHIDAGSYLWVRHEVTHRRGTR